MANFMVESGADPGEVVSTLNYLLSNLGNAPLGLTIDRQTGQIINNGTNTLTGYLYRFINISWANNIQGLYSSATSANQTFYGINNNDNPTYPTSNTNYVWSSIYDGVAGHPTAIGPANGVSLWFTVGGGRTITFVFATTSPGTSFVKFTDGSAIDLDAITSVGNSAVIGNNTVLGSNVTIGNYLTIGNYWTAGTNGNIGANLTVSGLITNSVLNADTVGTTQIVNLAVTSAKLANSSVTTGKIANYTVQAIDIANATITTQQVSSYTLLGTNLANATITNQQVQDYSLVGTDLANLTVTGQQVADYTLTGTKLANATVGTQQITNSAVTNAKLAANAVTTDKVQDYTLLGTDLANATITSQQIAMFTIVGDDIANATITSNKLAITSLSDISANAGNITAGSITGSGAGGAALITGYTAGQSTNTANIAVTNGTPSNLLTFSLSTPVSTRVVIALTGSICHWGNEANISYYNSMAGSSVYEILYSNSAVRSTFTNNDSGSIVPQRVSGTSYNYRMYVPSNITESLLLVPDTYTLRVTPSWFYRNNTTGNLVTPTNDTLTYVGRLATFQANIS
jgi:hypothetical protein